MELSWSTFVLEIINFLVLVWILKRFLYKPVLEVIARRRADIDSTLADAKNAQEEADALKVKYEGRLAEWDNERKQARESLDQEIEQERARKQASLKTDLEKQKEKAQVSEAHRQAESQRKAEETALALGARFASRVLEQAAGADTESRLIDLVIEELTSLSDERIAGLRNNWATVPDAIIVTTAFPIDDNQKHKLEQVLATVTNMDLPIEFKQDQTLVAGISITFGAWVLGASIRDELKGFAELAND
ncbi:MAG: F0F1 ATP synthase subunit delta [Acidiferrobacterales bacterium]|jgi:F-type H+-transporting ATPase subunit b|nr:F0F1 ATP synthase subunit delta [Acidiferrobacterales bacterium]